MRVVEVAVDASSDQRICHCHLTALDARLRRVQDRLELIEELPRGWDACGRGRSRDGFAVVGYSGRDASVMEALREGIDQGGAFPHGLYWFTSDPTDVLPAVRKLLVRAQERGVKAAFVEAANFDETFGILARHTTLPSALAAHVNSGSPPSRLATVALPTVESGVFPALRLNALPVLSLPERALKIRCKKPIAGYVRPLLREAKMPGVGVASGRDVIGFGVAHGFGEALETFEPESIEEVALGIGQDAPDPVVLGLLNEAVVRALGRDRPLRPLFRRSGHRLVVSANEGPSDPPLLQPLRGAYGGPLTGTLPGGDTRWMEGVRLRLEWRLGRPWLVFTPWTFLESANPQVAPQSRPRSRLAGQDPGTTWVKERWVRRRNEFWAGALGAWADVLVGSETGSFVALGLGDPRAVDAAFTIGRQTAYSLPAAPERLRA